MKEDFYVGYAPRAPRRLARRLRIVVVGLCLLVAALAVLLVGRQAAFGPGVFEYGVEREFTGIVLQRPAPTLFPLRPAGSERDSASGPLLLVAFGKKGADELIRGLHGQPVRVRGSLIHRDGHAMIEVHDLAPLAAKEAQDLVWPRVEGTDRGGVTLMGEVVDSKCFLGAMKPGHTKPHRACAVRCISGGVPPILLVLEPDGSARHVVLVSAQGEMINAAVLPFVAERVEITGKLRAFGDLEVLYADVSTYRRQP
jgi:hypothetical protein